MNKRKTISPQKVAKIKRIFPCFRDATSTEKLWTLYQKTTKASYFLQNIKPPQYLDHNPLLREVLQMGFLPKTIPTHPTACYETTLRARNRAKRFLLFLNDGNIRMSYFHENYLWLLHLQINRWFLHGKKEMPNPPINMTDLKVLRRMVYNFQVQDNIGEYERILPTFDWNWRRKLKDREELWDDVEHPYNQILIKNYDRPLYKKYIKGMKYAPNLKEEIEHHFSKYR